MTALETLRHIATLPEGTTYEEPGNEDCMSEVGGGVVTLPQPFLLLVLAEVDAIKKPGKREEELRRLLGLARAEPDLTDPDIWNEQVDEAMKGA